MCGSSSNRSTLARKLVRGGVRSSPPVAELHQQVGDGGARPLPLPATPGSPRERTRDYPLALVIAIRAGRRRGARACGGPVGSRRRSCLRHRDRRARQGGRGPSLPRRRHRGPRWPGAVREGLGAAGGRLVRARAAAGCPAPARRPHGRPAGGPPGRARDARPGVGAPGRDRHRRRAGPRRPGARLGDGAVVRGAVGPRDRPPAGAPDRDRPGHLDPGAVPRPLAGRGGPRPREGDRRLLDLGRGARHERFDLHRAGDHLHRRRRGRGAVRRRGRALGPAPRRCALAGADDAGRGGTSTATPRPGSRTGSTAASA